jgi:ethanolamine ammonia-lyase large subunit
VRLLIWYFNLLEEQKPLTHLLALIWTSKEGYEAGLSLNRGTVGNNLMYFETGQGSALSANAHWGLDQQTCETRAYAVARHFNPLLVNTVVGFIGLSIYLMENRLFEQAWKIILCQIIGLTNGCGCLLYQPRRSRPR